MKVELTTKYKSIPPFESVDIPSLTVLVGVNGTGKSQLLEAIHLQEAFCDVVAPNILRIPGDSHPGIVRLTNASLTLRADMFVSTDAADNGVSSAIFEAHRQAVFRQMAQSVMTRFRDIVHGDWSAAEILAMPREQLVSIANDHEGDDRTRNKRIEIIDQINKMLSESFYDNAHRPAQQAINRMVRHQNIEARLITYQDIKTFGAWGDHALFNSQLPRLFAGYRAEQIANNKLAKNGDRPAGADWLDAQAFQEKFGPPPWEQLSSIMKTLSLNFQIAPPSQRNIDPVVLFFERLDDGTHIEFSSLSAGEKVLVILAIALLNINPFRVAVQRPQLLLLDEIDASLHPAVLHQWMTTIREKVVGEMGIPCIMTTHSPITVALAPETSLYEMSRERAPLTRIRSC